MGKISILTKEQKFLLDLISKNKYFADTFYFTGGTALSEYYLRHRFSDDLAFFSQSKIEQDIIFTIINNWSDKIGFKIQSRFVDVVYRFELSFPTKVTIKIDEFKILPKMMKPLTLKELKIFFRQKAKELASKVVE